MSDSPFKEEAQLLQIVIVRPVRYTAHLSSILQELERMHPVKVNDLTAVQVTLYPFLQNTAGAAIGYVRSMAHLFLPILQIQIYYIGQLHIEPGIMGLSDRRPPTGQLHIDLISDTFSKAYKISLTLIVLPILIQFDAMAHVLLSAGIKDGIHYMHTGRLIFIYKCRLIHRLW